MQPECIGSNTSWLYSKIILAGGPNTCYPIPRVSADVVNTWEVHNMREGTVCRGTVSSACLMLLLLLLCGKRVVVS